VICQLYTASWTSLRRASQRDSLPLQPVRISRGEPKFWPAAARFPALDELMPDSWMLGCQDAGKVERGYRGKLGRIGLERIAGRLDAIAAECDGLPLALCCFEASREDCHRSWAAAWLYEQTGLAVPEIGSMRSERASALFYEVEAPMRELVITRTADSGRKEPRP
jgi:hypothetical protein